MEGHLRAAGAAFVALMLGAAAIAVVSSPRTGLIMMPAAQTCPPPCVPHVFSAAEESMLAGGQSKGKLMLPGGDSAVMEAMKAANDANGQMTALSPDAASPSPSAPPANPFQPTRTASAVIGHGGKPFVSQWDQMHGEAEGNWQTHASARSATSSAASDAVVGTLQSNLRASSGTLGAERQAHSGESHDGVQDATNTAEGDDRAIHSGETLSQALRQLSNRRLRAIVRLLLKARATNDDGFSGRRGGVSELRAILDGSRKQQEEKRQQEQEELRHVRKAMDELAYQASRRRAEDDAIAALSRRLGGDQDRSDGSRRGALADGQRSGSLLERTRGGARMDDLFEEGDVRPRHGERARAVNLFQLLGRGGERVREQGVRRDGHEERVSLRDARGGVAGVESNKALVQELAALAARSTRGEK